MKDRINAMIHEDVIEELDHMDRRDLLDLVAPDRDASPNLELLVQELARDVIRLRHRIEGSDGLEFQLEQCRLERDDFHEGWTEKKRSLAAVRYLREAEESVRHAREWAQQDVLHNKRATTKFFGTGDWTAKYRLDDLKEIEAAISDAIGFYEQTVDMQRVQKVEGLLEQACGSGRQHVNHLKNVLRCALDNVYQAIDALEPLEDDELTRLRRRVTRLEMQR